MYAFLTVVRYPRWSSWAGFLSMAYFRFPLYLNKQVKFYKLLGCGKNGTFDKTPDLRQWGVLAVTNELEKFTANETIDDKKLFGSFITGWWKLFGCKKWTIVLEPIEGHGTWDGKEAFGKLPKSTDYDGIIGVLTRATINLNRLQNFWSHVAPVANKMSSSAGFITSLGIGEVPWVKQATFSIWENKESMKNFSYKMREHTEVIKKTRSENWYSEEMFVRFKILASIGSLNGTNPLEGKL